jgi:hypothetical protein
MFVKAILHNKEDDLHFLLKCLIEEVREDSILKAKDFGSVAEDRKEEAKRQKAAGKAITIDADLGVVKPKGGEYDSIERQIKDSQELYGVVSFAQRKFGAEQIIDAYEKRGAIQFIADAITELEALVKAKHEYKEGDGFAEKVLIPSLKRRQDKAKKMIPQYKKRVQEMNKQLADAKKIVAEKDKKKEQALKDINEGKDLIVGEEYDKEAGQTKPVKISNAKIKQAMREQLEEASDMAIAVQVKVAEIKAYLSSERFNENYFQYEDIIDVPFAGGRGAIKLESGDYTLDDPTKPSSKDSVSFLLPDFVSKVKGIVKDTLKKPKRAFGKEIVKVMTKKEVKEVMTEIAQRKELIARLEKIKNPSKANKDQLKKAKTILRLAENKLKRNEENIKANELTDEDLAKFARTLDEVIKNGMQLTKTVEVKVSYRKVLETIDKDLLRDLESYITTPEIKRIMNEKLFKDFLKVQAKRELTTEKTKQKILNQLLTDKKQAGKKLNVYIRVLGVLQKELDRIELTGLGKIKGRKVKQLSEKINKLKEMIVETKGKVAQQEKALTGKTTIIGQGGKIQESAGFAPKQTTLTFYNNLEKSIRSFKDSLVKRKSRDRRAAVALKQFSDYNMKDVLFVIEAIYGRIDTKGRDTGKTLEKIKKDWNEANDKVNEKIKAIEEKDEEYKSKKKDGASPEILRTIARAISREGVGLGEALKERTKKENEYRTISGALALRPVTERGYITIAEAAKIIDRKKNIKEGGLNPLESTLDMRPQIYIDRDKRLKELRERQSKRIKKQDKIESFRYYDVGKDGTVETRTLPMSENNDAYQKIKKKIEEIKKLLGSTVTREGKTGEEFEEGKLETILLTAIKDSMDLDPVDLTEAGQKRRKEIQDLAKKLREENRDLDGIESTISKVFGDTLLNNVDDIEEEIQENVYDFLNGFFGRFTKDIEILEAVIPIKEKEFKYIFDKGEYGEGTPNTKKVKYQSIEEIKEIKNKVDISKKFTKDIARKLNILPTLGKEKQEKPTGEMLGEYFEKIKEIAKDVGEIKETEAEKQMEAKVKSSKQAKETILEEAKALEVMFVKYEDRVDDLEKTFDVINKFVKKYSQFRKQYISLSKQSETSRFRMPTERPELEPTKFTARRSGASEKDYADEKAKARTVLEFVINENLSAYDKNIKSRKKEIKQDGKAKTKRSSSLPILTYSIPSEEEKKKEYKGVMKENLTEEQRQKIMNALGETASAKASQSKGKEVDMSVYESEDIGETKRFERYINQIQDRLFETLGTDEDEVRPIKFKQVDDSFIESTKNTLANNFEYYIDKEQGIKLGKVKTARELADVLEEIEGNIREERLPRVRRKSGKEKDTVRVDEDKTNELSRDALERVLKEILPKLISEKAKMTTESTMSSIEIEKSKLRKEFLKEFEKMFEVGNEVINFADMKSKIKVNLTAKELETILLDEKMGVVKEAGQDLLPLIRQYKSSVIKLQKGTKELQKEVGEEE